MHCRVILLSASVRRLFLLFGLASFSQRLMLFEKVFLIGLKGIYGAVILLFCSLHEIFKILHHASFKSVHASMLELPEWSK